MKMNRVERRDFVALREAGGYREKRGSVKRGKFLSTHLFGLLVEDGRHGEDGGALVQRRSETFPVLVELSRDLFDLRGGVVTRLGETTRHRHDPVDVHIGILGE